MIHNARIGAINYDVEEVPDLHVIREEKKVRLNGHILHDVGKIRVDADLCHDVKLVTVWHELLHGILTVAGHDEQPELIIETLGYGLVLLLRQNPHLITLTLEESEHGRTASG